MTIGNGGPSGGPLARKGGALYDSRRRQWVLTGGSLAYWLPERGPHVRVVVELVTRDWVYFKATGDDAGMTRGQVWREGRYSRRVVPREAAYVYGGKVHVDWATVSVREA